MCGYFNQHSHGVHAERLDRGSMDIEHAMSTATRFQYPGTELDAKAAATNYYRWK